MLSYDWRFPALPPRRGRCGRAAGAGVRCGGPSWPTAPGSTCGRAGSSAPTRCSTGCSRRCRGAPSGGRCTTTWLTCRGCSVSTTRTRRCPIRCWTRPVLALDAYYGPELGEPLSTVGLCLYRDGRDSVAWHGDTSGRQVRATIVAIVSLGNPRALALRPRGGGSALRYEVGHGDLLVMGGTCQRTWQHAIPKTARATGPADQRAVPAARHPLRSSCSGPGGGPLRSAHPEEPLDVRGVRLERGGRSAASGANGCTASWPADRLQVATARPSTSANGRNIPFTVTIPWCAPRIGSRDAQPCSTGSKEPSRRGGGSSRVRAGGRPGRPGRRRADPACPAMAASPRRASRSGSPAHLARSRSVAGP